MGIKNIDFEQTKFKSASKYVVAFDDGYKANISRKKVMSGGHSMYTETTGNFSIDERDLGKTYICETHKGMAPEEDSNTLLEEYLPEVIAHLEEIQTNPKVIENASVSEPLHGLTLATETLLTLYQKEVSKQRVESDEGLSGSIKF